MCSRPFRPAVCPSMSLATPRLHSLALPRGQLPVRLGPFYVADPISSITSKPHHKHLPEMIPGFGAGLVIETRSLPNLLVATLATLPSMSLIPSAPFPICGNRRLCARCNREKTWWCRRRQDRARLTAIPNLGARHPAQARPRPAVMLALANAIFELLYPNLKTQAVFTVPTRALVLDKH